jgi:hypothetical protein
MIYSNEPRVIELLPRDGWNIGYFVGLAHSIGGEHIPVVSEHDSCGDGATGRNDADFSVDIRALEAVL